MLQAPDYDSNFWKAMRALADGFRLEPATSDAGVILDPAYGEELAYATLQFGKDGRLWLGLKDGSVLSEPHRLTP